MIWLYGQAPGRGASRQGRTPLASYVPLLARLAGLTEEEWRDAVSMANVLPDYPGPAASGKGDAFPMELARERAWVLMQDWWACDFVLFAGKQVAAAFGLTNVDYFEWSRPGGVAVSVIPHPSRVNHFWNRTDADELVSRHLRATLLEAKGE